jgi:alpha-beta hydrolase superfamily lysophospholipase
MHEELWASSRETSLRMRAYDGAADDPAVVVLHGLAAGVDVLSEARADLDPYEVLRDAGCHVLALDWPGHGRSGGPRGHLTYRMAMDAAATAVAAAHRRWRRPTALFGVGFGGVLAFYAGLEDERVAAVASAGLLDLRDIRPVLRRTRRAVAFPLAAAAARLLGVRAQRRVSVPVSMLLSRHDLADDPSLARTLWAHPQAVHRYSLAGLLSIFCVPEGKPDVRAQRAPVLAAVGSRDTLLPETTTRAFTQRLTCPTDLWVLPGAGHQLFVEHPRALLPVVAAFVRRHADAQRATG